MNTSSEILKEEMIREYVSGIDYTNVSVSKIKEDLQRIIQEIPAIQLDYKKERGVSEKTGKKTVIKESVKSITVAFTDGTDEQGNPRVVKKTYFI